MNTMISTISLTKRAALTAALMLFVAVAGATAQSRDRVLVSVPFAFAAGDASLPSGEYLVSRRGPNVLELRATDGDAAALLTTTPLNVDAAGGRQEVVFHRYGDRYFFAGVRTHAGEMVYRAARSKDEQRLAKAGVEREVLGVAIR